MKEILLKINFIEEMRTTRNNKKMPQKIFYNSLYSRKYDLILWLRTIGNIPTDIIFVKILAD